MARRRCSKTKALKGHAKSRSFQRYDGVTLSNRDLRAIVHKIQTRDGEFVEKKSNRVTEWKISYNETLWRVRYDKTRGVIITFLPVDS
ncbi:MAG: hypothetical protein UW32_C0001G0189 [Candidatus Wolfebacteria bacterium GW2011_GWE2_44_13]|uniref:DUF4258 domain-containing protein n=1 Tax=Candidatus Wolfebacteria bacterium GW2011_GWE2_44_13 TaxID=1619017 RepID=A0A0G1JI03_9BACT|nr:MAG: hypothetical protein UW32_C0001G0189 [Candidatus Wolfebacteria bacterium GW2011_GWE2_44_13]